jgi:hypothetical protein
MAQQKGFKRAVKVARRKRKLEVRRKEANLRKLSRKAAEHEHEHEHAAR